MEFTREQNKALIEHFPYLQPRSLWTDEIVKDYDYGYIKGQWDLPDGWHRLFLLYCKAIKPVLKKVDFIDKFRFSQLKEKWGVMTLYNNGYPKEVYEELSDLNSIYCRISTLICQRCGKPADIETRGWIGFLCNACKPETFTAGDYYNLKEPNFIVKLESWEPSVKSNSITTDDYNKIIRELDCKPYYNEYIRCLNLTDSEFIEYLTNK